VKTHLSIGRSPQKEVTRTWMDIHLVGRLRGPHGRQIGSLIEFLKCQLFVCSPISLLRK
jgi:hypothetical protein